MTGGLGVRLVGDSLDCVDGIERGYLSLDVAGIDRRLARGRVANRGVPPVVLERPPWSGLEVSACHFCTRAGA